MVTHVEADGAIGVLLQHAPFAVAITLRPTRSLLGGLGLGVIPTSVVVRSLAALVLGPAIKLATLNDASRRAP